VTADEVRDLLRQEVQKAGSQRALAEQLGVSQPFLNDVLKGNREPSAKLLEPLGLVRVVEYRAV
jgi:transcriptional regulator with XRE-family HTH domain